MFNIGFTEMMVIAGLALILIGPKQLPEVARSLGRMLNEFKRSADILKDEFQSQLTMKDEQKNQESPTALNNEIEQHEKKKTDDDGSDA